jgi:hypothetical protein
MIRTIGTVDQVDVDVQDGYINLETPRDLRVLTPKEARRLAWYLLEAANEVDP